ncbi:hypothetical protein SELMODRAFT_421237 [Selaginella moellendorffii]|uniref:Uncharacterized protein n=1 Tax=Selaginella moellendorffii TaxID=88036 RepID=D8SEF7_SELML|nr:hypothetical protein SELMODRAFT_421237 [Selaginella moellendorffii]
MKSKYGSIELLEESCKLGKYSARVVRGMIKGELGLRTKEKIWELRDGCRKAWELGFNSLRPVCIDKSLLELLDAVNQKAKGPLSQQKQKVYRGTHLLENKRNLARLERNLRRGTSQARPGLQIVQRGCYVMDPLSEPEVCVSQLFALMEAKVASLKAFHGIPLILNTLLSGSHRHPAHFNGTSETGAGFAKAFYLVPRHLLISQLLELDAPTPLIAVVVELYRLVKLQRGHGSFHKWG